MVKSGTWERRSPDILINFNFIIGVDWKEEIGPENEVTPRLAVY